MRPFADWSISRKVVAVTMMASVLALTLSAAALLAYEWFAYRESLVSAVSAAAQMLGANSTAALAFSDEKAAAETLSALKGEQRVEEACIFTDGSRPFACYSRSGNAKDLRIAPRADGAYFAGRYLEWQGPIRLGSERIGSIYIKSNLSELYTRMRNFAGIVFPVLAMALAAALAVSSRLQRVVSRPILELAETAGRVSAESCYSIRAERRSNDETGLLVDRFNEMMEQIHSRDLALQAAREGLERRVEERTAQLQVEIAERKAIERDLIAAKEAAEQSDRAKSAFLANMSHELRTPLNAIIGYSEMIGEDAADTSPEIAGDAAKIRGAGKHLLSLINDVLDLSKVEAGRLEIHREPFLVGQLVQEIAALAEPLAARNRNRFEADCRIPTVVFETDQKRFRQSLFNLISNACKFTEDGVVRLEVEEVDAGGRRCFDWRVTDTGIGIAPEHRSKLFQSFSQIDSSSTRKHGGTGLGLAISKRLCELMGGEILVESTPGVGSTFTVRLPAEAAGEAR